MTTIDYQINNIFLFPYQFALQHFRAFSQEAEWNGRAVMHLVLGIFEILPTGINYIIAIFDAVFNRTSSQVPDPLPEPQTPTQRPAPLTTLVPVDPAAPGWPSLPTDLLGESSTFLTPKELGRCTSVCKSWGKYINQTNLIWNWQAHRAGIINSMTNISNTKELFAKPDIAFGRAEWLRYMGDPGTVPPLPENIYEILSSPCPFWPEKTIKETHILVLIPKTILKIVDSQPVTYPLTFKTFNELLKSSNNQTSAKCRVEAPTFLAEYGDLPITQSHWVLMTNATIPPCFNPIDARYSYKKSLIESRGYRVPNYLDTIISIFMENIRSGRHLFSLNWTFCQETLNNGAMMSLVGGFRPNSCQLRITGAPVDWYLREDQALDNSFNLAAVRTL